MNEPPEMSDEEFEAYLDSLRAMARSEIREDAIFPLSNLLREHAFGPDYDVIANHARRFVLGSDNAPLLIDFEPGQQEPVRFEIRHDGRIVMVGVLVTDDEQEGDGIYYGDSADIFVTIWERGPWEELIWEGVERVELL